MRNFKFKDSCFSEEHTFMHNGRLYEFIGSYGDEAPPSQFRVILAEDDYDYVEDVVCSKSCVKNIMQALSNNRLE